MKRIGAVRIGAVKKLGAVLATVLVALTSITAPAPAADRGQWNTRLFSRVPAPGFPAYVHVHTNGRVYAGSYVDPGSSTPSRVFEWRADGTLLRSWTVPGQRLDADHGVQVAAQTKDGKLVLLETSRSAVLTLDVRTGRFRAVATLRDLPSCTVPGEQGCSPSLVDAPAVPNYATWGPGGLYVTDYAQAVIWRVSRAGVARPWFRSRGLDGAEFGTTGIRYRPATRDLLVTQQAVLDGTGLPTNGRLYRLPISSDGRPGRLHTMWSSRPGDLPDGFGIGRSGAIYIAATGSAQLVKVGPGGKELNRVPDVPLLGSNGSGIPFDTPCSATFLGSSVLVANQSAIVGDADHQAILDVHVGERGVAPYLPRGARFRTG